VTVQADLALIRNLVKVGMDCDCRSVELEDEHDPECRRCRALVALDRIEQETTK
jgi:hypothetical protein